MSFFKQLHLMYWDLASAADPDMDKIEGYTPADGLEFMEELLTKSESRALELDAAYRSSLKKKQRDDRAATYHQIALLMAGLTRAARVSGDKVKLAELKAKLIEHSDAALREHFKQQFRKPA